MSFIDTLSGGVNDNIHKGAQSRHTVMIKYSKKDGVSERETEPYEIKEGAYWGYDVDAGSIKRFMLSNIVEARVTENTFNPRWAVKL